MGQKQFFLEWLPRHRDSRILKAIDRLALSYHRKFSNLNYACETNGEGRVLAILAKTVVADAVLFDVGANVGAWAEIAAPAFPSARIYSFEPLPKTYEQLVRNTRTLMNVQPCNVGLSDRAGVIEFAHKDGADVLSSALPKAFESIHGAVHQLVSCQVVDGDGFCRDNGIAAIEFLKIDTEGFEGHVLDGFSNMLTAGAMKVIQIEYGKANIFSGFLLKDLFEKLGTQYAIGKIYPRRVDFQSYSTRDEDFIGPNFLAVRKTEPELIARLSRD